MWLFEEAVRFLNHVDSGLVITPWAEDQPSARSLPTHRINADIHPRLEWDSNP
jgi:hypothetical protein